MKKKKKGAADDIAVSDHESSGGAPPASGGGSGMGRFISLAVLPAIVVMLLAGAGLGWLSQLLMS